MMLKYRRQRDSFLPWLWLAIDVATIYLWLGVAFWTRFKSGHFDS